jgi:hypothetical protein
MPTWVTIAVAAALFVGTELWDRVQTWMRELRDGSGEAQSPSQTVLMLTVSDASPNASPTHRSPYRSP